MLIAAFVPKDVLPMAMALARAQNGNESWSLSKAALLCLSASKVLRPFAEPLIWNIAAKAVLDRGQNIVGRAYVGTGCRALRARPGTATHWLPDRTGKEHFGT